MKELKEVWDDDLISDWMMTLKQIKLKGGGCGALFKAERCLYKSWSINSLSFWVGLKSIYEGSCVLKGCLKYSGVYNQDTVISKKQSSVLLMKVSEGVEDEGNEYGPQLCLTVGRCSNLLGQRYVCIDTLKHSHKQ